MSANICTPEEAVGEIRDGMTIATASFSGVGGSEDELPLKCRANCSQFILFFFDCNLVLKEKGLQNGRKPSAL